MNQTRLRARFRAACTMFVATGVAISSATALAASHALIMTIDYAGTERPLPGISTDAELARRMAHAIGIEQRHIVDLRNRELTRDGIRLAIDRLLGQLEPGDKVFLYFSGHGQQVAGLDTGRRCSEGVVAADLRLYFDSALQSDLNRLASKAGQVIMFNDSCFAGGAATKSLAPADPAPTHLNGVTTTVAKFYPNAVFQRTPDDPDPLTGCGAAVNRQFGKSLLEAARATSANVLYMAAAADDEVAYATNIGSMATLAWAHCIGARDTDTNASGALDGEELRACAQDWVERNDINQTITLVGDAKLPVFLGSDAQATRGLIKGNAALEDYRSTASKDYQVTLSPARSVLRIGRDKFDFSVSTNRSGYLYILLVGSDGRSFYQLFPNDNDQDNFVQAGTHHFPRPEWEISAQGPAGVNHLMAVVSPVQRRFGELKGGIFASADVDPGFVRNLVSGPSGGFGASAVVSVQEVSGQ